MVHFHQVCANTAVLAGRLQAPAQEGISVFHLSFIQQWSQTFPGKLWKDKIGMTESIPLTGN